MIAIDTNIVVRFLTQDDPAQFKQAARLFRETELFIAESVLLETEWVLRFAYGFSPSSKRLPWITATTNILRSRIR